MKTKQIQIPQALFAILCRYFLVGETEEDFLAIRRGLQTKLDSISAREAYTTYKTSRDPEAQEAARQEYLNRRGVPDNFRHSKDA